MACGGCSHEKSQIKNKLNFIVLHLIVSCYYCFIDLKRQSEHSGLRPDTSSLVQFQLFSANLDFFIVNTLRYFSILAKLFQNGKKISFFIK